MHLQFSGDSDEAYCFSEHSRQKSVISEAISRSDQSTVMASNRKEGSKHSRGSESPTNTVWSILTDRSSPWRNNKSKIKNSQCDEAKKATMPSMTFPPKKSKRFTPAEESLLDEICMSHNISQSNIGDDNDEDVQLRNPTFFSEMKRQSPSKTKNQPAIEARMDETVDAYSAVGTVSNSDWSIDSILASLRDIEHERERDSKRDEVAHIYLSSSSASSSYSYENLTVKESHRSERESSQKGRQAIERVAI